MAPSRATAFKPDQLFQQSQEPMFWLDSQLRFAWVNRSWEVMTGLSADLVLGQVCRHHGPGPEDEDEASRIAASFVPPAEAIAGRPSSTLTQLWLNAGEPFWRRIEFWPFQDREGALHGLLGRVGPPDSPAAAPGSRDHRLRVALMTLRDELRKSHGIETLIGTGPAHQRLVQQILAAAGGRFSVLLIGEPGTGKSLVARTIHQLGQRGDEPFLLLDCEALPAEILERELQNLFPEAFSPSTGEPSVQDESSATAAPNLSATGHAEPPVSPGGSLLLRGVRSLPRDLQRKLAQAMDGSTRLLATATEEFGAAVADDEFHHDLYCKLTVIVLRLEPLRNRRHDLPLLAQYFLERANRRETSPCAGFLPSALDAMQAYDWPGNLAELGRVIDAAHARAATRAAESSGGPIFQIQAEDLPASIRGNLAAAYLPPRPSRTFQPLDELLTEIERKLIESALGKARQNKSRAADLLGISRPRLYRRIKELRLADDGDPEDEAFEADVK